MTLSTDLRTDGPSLAETRDTLVALARRRFGDVPEEFLVDHVLSATPDADFAVRRAAVAALARRYAFAERDGLAVTKAPPRRAVFGDYRTARTLGDDPSPARPYTTTLASLAPLRVPCSCADYARSSLGLCKHGLTVLAHISATKALHEAARIVPPAPKAPLLAWDPVHPPHASADRLARLRFESVGGVRAPRGLRHNGPDARQLDDLGRRLGFIERLREALDAKTLVADASVRRVLDEEHLRALRLRRCETAFARNRKALATLKRTLYPYQVEGVERFLRTGRLLLADDMGLGKTTQAIACCHALLVGGAVRRGLLIVPSALKPQWKREWDATTDVPLVRVEGTPEERARSYATTKEGFLVIGYEQLLRDLDGVRSFAPEIVVLDEAQRIKNWATKSAAYVKSLDAAYRLVLTGTPMENRFDELASIMDFVDDLALEPKWRLTPLHQIDDGDGGAGRGGARNLELLRRRLAPSMLRRVRHDVLSQLPSRSDTRIPVEMTPAQLERHDEFSLPIAQLVARSVHRPLTQPEFLRLMSMLTAQRILCNGIAQADFDDHWPAVRVKPRATPAVLEGLFMPKLAVLRGLVDQVAVGQRRKMVVFSQWRKMLRLAEWAVRDALADAGLRAVFFTGAESSAQRERAVVDFHDDPSVAVMFLSDAGGVGLNLQRAASCCVNLELPWNPAVLEQRIGRIHRLGQALPIDVYNLVAEDGIEGRIAMILAQKKAVFSSLFDGTSDDVRFDGSAGFLASVRRILEPVEVPPSTVETEPEMEVAAPVPELPEPVASRPEEPAAETPPVDTEPVAATPATDDAVAPPSDGPRVTKLADGGLRIDVPPALAGPLAAMLEALAATLRGG